MTEQSRLRALRNVVGRRTVPAAYGLRRQADLVGWRRIVGPPTSRGAGRPVSAAEATVPVVICVWRRPHLLAGTLAALGRQTFGAIDVLLWNNAPSLREQVDDIVRNSGGPAVDVVHSSRNVGGFGRFYVARSRARGHRRVVFLDDDQFPDDRFVETLLEEHEPRSARGVHAFRFNGLTSYADRVLAQPGERVAYCGTGGMVVDSRVFTAPGLYKCPRRFWFVEDLWLSYYLAAVLKWPLYRSDAQVETGRDDLDQYRLLGPTKERFYRYLVRRGWRPNAPCGSAGSEER